MAIVAAISWCWATASGAVPLDTAGDESGRLLQAYTVATPHGIVHEVANWRSWTEIHPPGDIAFRATLNMLVGTVTNDPDTLVRVNQASATILVVIGVAGIAYGLKAVDVTSVAVFLGLALPSAAVIYVAHHTLGENLALALVGIGTGLALRGTTVIGGLVIGLAGAVRPEVALVFSSVAVVPLGVRLSRRAGELVILAAAPAICITLLTEFAGARSYASLRLFRARSVFDVAVRGEGPTVYWGLGIRPWVAIVLSIAVVAAGARIQIPVFSPGRLLIAAWMVWSLVFAAMAARGAIPTQVRTYVALHLLGALALAVASSEVLTSWRPSGAQLASAVAAIAIGGAIISAREARHEWSRDYPADVAAVNTFLAGFGERGILTDWMWWREWSFGVYATNVGGDVCNYYMCTTGTDATPSWELTVGLTPVEVDRLTAAWRFVDRDPPALIGMFTEASYDAWRAWERGGNLEVLSSFVRPLLEKDGECFRTVTGLIYARYCPAFSSGRYVILSRQ